MHEQPVCPECGAPVRRVAPVGHCPSCLLRIGLSVADGGLAFGLDENSPKEPTAGPLTSADPVRIRYVGDYELLGELGRGGMGVVYQARQGSLNRLVALKLVRAGEFADEKEIARFRAEAEAAGHLDHPNIVPIYEVGEHEGRHYFSMKLVAGGSLAGRISNSQISNRDAASLLATIARAVHYAHQRGLLHRDLKPGNILLDRDGQPHITDFGLARRIDTDSAMTQAGTIVGTPSYIAPEQAAGAKVLTTGADVYSLGAILYELLAGRPPFVGATVMETLQKVLNEEPVPPSRLNAERGKRNVETARRASHRLCSSFCVPHSALKDLETICLKCLEKDPARRYGSAESLAEDLGRWLRHEPIRARPTTPAERFQKWTRRNPLLAGALAAILVVGLCGLAGILWQWRAAQLARNAEQAQREHAERALWESLASQARAERMSFTVGRRDRILAAVLKASRLRTGAVLRDEAAAALAIPDLSPPLWERAGSNLEFCPHFDGRFEYYVTDDRRGSLHVHAVSNHVPVVTLSTTNLRAGAVRFSPDGRWLAGWFDPGRLHVWEWREQRAVFSANVGPSDGERTRMAFSPDNRSLVLAMSERHLEVFEVATGALKSSTPLSGTPGNLAFAADGTQIAFSIGERVEVWDVKAMELRQTCILDEPVRSLAWHPNGRLLAVGAFELGQIVLWDLTTTNRMILEGHRGAVETLLFRPQGDLLISGSWDGTTRFWDPYSGRMLSVTEPRSGTAAQLSDDGQQLAYAIQWRTFGTWRIQSPVAFQKLALSRVGHPVTECIAFSADHRLVAAGSNEGCWIWEVASGKVVWRTKLRDIRSVYFQSTNRLLASGSDGVFSWRLDRTGLPGSQNPEVLVVPQNNFERSGLSQDGTMMGVVGSDEALIFPVDDPARNRSIAHKQESRLNDISLSPDGRQFATGTWNGTGPAIWDAATAKLVRRLPGGPQGKAVFMPDGGHVLTVSGFDLALFETGRWQPVRRGLLGTAELKGRHPAFSPDGQLLAVATPDERVRLLDTQSGLDNLILTPPDRQPIRRLVFSQDGQYLAVATDNYEVHLWDLAELRRELARLDLDWQTEVSSGVFSPRRR